MNTSSAKSIYKKVMVVDDSDIDRFVASYNIKRYGLAEEVILKESAKSALEYLKLTSVHLEKLPSIIFLDIRMPEMDGFEFLDEFANLPEIVQQSCTVIMLSSSIDPNDQARAEENKFVRQFMSKPLDEEKLQPLLQAPQKHKIS